MLRKILKISKILLVCFVSLISILVITFSIINYNLKYEMPQILNIELYDNNNQKYLSVSNNRKQSYVTLDEISPYVIDAFIAIEDKRFYDHQGVDFIRIGGAIISDIKNQEFVEGASTITQQYVKNLYLSSDKTIERKLHEVMIAMNIERQYNKNDILAGYLNSIYFDSGAYGIEDASIYYFGKSAKDLNLVEACSLAAIPKSPSNYSPIKNPENNKTRRNLILQELYNDGKINEETLISSKASDINLVGKNPNMLNENAPYFQDLVLKELSTMGWLNDYTAKGLKVYTTLDSKLNNSIIKSINKRLPNEEIEAAVYALNPKTGEVLAVVGGTNYQDSSFNRAVDALRQSGSTIKPFLYLAALENGFTPATTFKSEKTTFYVNGEAYSPNNYADIYANQDVSMVYALATSDNIYAVKTHLFLGTDTLVNMLKRLKISGNIPSVASLALGTYEISLQELSTAYSVLANEGVYLEPTLITKITTFDDEVLYENKSKTVERLANIQDVYLLNESMTSIFDNSMTYNIRPTGGRLVSLLTHKYAAKSGSTKTDNLMVGYNPDILVAVWTGYDDNRIIENHEDTTFGKYIWAEVIESYLKDKHTSWYETPEGIISVDLNPMTGFYPAIGEYHKDIYFKRNNIPWYIELLYNK
ncbi:MAG: PBP1A family penicillin-binding protein [Bacilli bacterium]|nr:PBP1A family penicillin-binding protein [Bacilli bacterium]